MKNIPNKIYLQVDPEKENPEFFSELETTWCSDRINDNDIPYYRKQSSVEPVVIQQTDNKVKWFMELALKMREVGYSDTSIYSIDIDAWDEYRIKEKLTPKQAIAEEESNS